MLYYLDSYPIELKHTHAKGLRSVLSPSYALLNLVFLNSISSQPRRGTHGLKLASGTIHHHHLSGSSSSYRDRNSIVVDPSEEEAAAAAVVVVAMVYSSCSSTGSQLTQRTIPSSQNTVRYKYDESLFFM